MSSLMVRSIWRTIKASSSASFRLNHVTSFSSSSNKKMESSSVINKEEPSYSRMSPWERFRNLTSGVREDGVYFTLNATNKISWFKVFEGYVNEILFGKIRVIVGTLDYQFVTLELNKTDTIGMVKNYVEEHLKVHPKQQYLYYYGEFLEDDFSVSHYNINRDTAVILFVPTQPLFEKFVATMEPAIQGLPDI